MKVRMNQIEESRKLKGVFISDTHGKHKELILPEGDIIFHAGDVSSTGTISEIQEFLEWFEQLDYSYKIFIAGNHDFYFEKENDEKIKEIIPENIIYLNDSGVEIQGNFIWGSPIQPWFFDWAFNRKRGAEILHHWNLIPKKTDILLTHGPPYGVLDKTVRGQHVGCEELQKILEIVQPRIHAFGHIHEAYGVLEKEGCTYVNASVLNFKYQLVHQAIVLEI